MADQPTSPAPTSAPAPASASEPAFAPASEPAFAPASEPGLEVTPATTTTTTTTTTTQGLEPTSHTQPPAPAASVLDATHHPRIQHQPSLPTSMDPNGMVFTVDGQPIQLMAYQDPNFAAPVNMMMPLGGGHQMNLPIGNGAHLGHGTDTGHQNVKDITADEIALYDRQIRLWGIQAQKRIQGAKVLLITMKALANEIAKNLVLAGIGSLTVVDDHIVEEADLGAQFFLSKDHIGQNRAEAASGNIRKLNPRVQVTADSESIMTKGASYFAGFDIIIATDLFPTTLAFINTATRLHGRQFYAAGTHGLYGYIFCDLIEHDYVLQREKSNVPAKLGEETRTRSVIDVKEKKEGGKTIEMITKRELYSTWDLASETSLLPADYRNSKRRLKAVTPALSCLRALWSFQSAQNRDPSRTQQDLQFFARSATFSHQGLMLPAETLRSDFLRSFLSNIGSEIAPVTAILGGQLAQDVINVLGQSQPPIQNMVIFDGNTMQAEMYPLHPEVPLGKAQLDMSMPVMPAMGGVPPNPAPGMYNGQFPDMTNPPPPM